jgi:F-type H+-transporting ATPase subunit a
LFGNIFAGEILLVVVSVVIAAHLGLISVLANAGPVFIYVFNMLIGLIQAVVFTLLTAAYLITPTSDDAH